MLQPDNPAETCRLPFADRRVGDGGILELLDDRLCPRDGFVRVPRKATL